MARESKYFKEIERLLGIGYEPKHIMKITGIPRATVYRVTNKMQIEARHDFKRTMTHDFLWKYQQNMENYSKTIQQCNEEIVKMNQKYDEIESKINTEIAGISDTGDNRGSMVKATLLGSLTTNQSARVNELIKLTAQRDKATEGKAKLFNQGPVVYAMDEFVNGSPAMGELPKVKEVEDMRKDLNKALDKPLDTNINQPEKPPRLNSLPSKDEEISDEDRKVLEEMDKDE